MINTNNEAQQSKLPTQLLPDRTAYHTERRKERQDFFLALFASLR